MNQALLLAFTGLCSKTVAEEVMDSQRSRSQSSTTGISPTTTNRSPGSIISPGTINFQYSDSQSEADKQTGLLQAPFSNEVLTKTFNDVKRVHLFVCL